MCWAWNFHIPVAPVCFFLSDVFWFKNKQTTGHFVNLKDWQLFLLNKLSAYLVQSTLVISLKHLPDIENQQYSKIILTML